MNQAKQLNKETKQSNQTRTVTVTETKQGHHCMLTNIPDTFSNVNRQSLKDATINEKKRIYLEDMAKAHRKETQRAYLKRKKTGVKATSRINLKGMLNEICFLELILFLTENGTQVKKTSRQWLAEDLNRLRSPDERQMAPRTVKNWVSKAKKIQFEGRPILKFTNPRQTKVDRETGQLTFVTMGIWIQILNVEDFISHYATQLLNYYHCLCLDLTDEFLTKKVENKVVHQLRKIDHPITRTLVDNFLNPPVDNSVVCDKNGPVVRQEWAVIVRQEWALLSNTKITFPNTKNIPAEAGNFSLKEEGIQEEPMAISRQEMPDEKKGVIGHRPTIVYDNVPRGTTDSVIGPLVVREEPEFRWDEDGHTEDEAIHLVTHIVVPEPFTQAVNILMKRNETRFEPLKKNAYLYRQAAQELAARAFSICQNPQEATKSEIMGLATFVIDEYLAKADLYGHNTRPKFWDEIKRDEEVTRAKSPHDKAQRQARTDEHLKNLHQLHAELKVYQLNKTPKFEPLVIEDIDPFTVDLPPPSPLSEDQLESMARSLCIDPASLADLQRKLNEKNALAKKSQGCDNARQENMAR